MKNNIPSYEGGNNFPSQISYHEEEKIIPHEERKIHEGTIWDFSLKVSSICEEKY